MGVLVHEVLGVTILPADFVEKVYDDVLAEIHTHLFGSESDATIKLFLYESSRITGL